MTRQPSPRPAPRPDHRRVRLLGYPVDAIDLDGLLCLVDEMVASGGRHTIGYANVHTINQALEHPEVTEFWKTADLVYCDGGGIRMGARLLGQSLPERMTGADWIWDLASHAAAAGHGLYWIGGREGVAAEACRRLRAAAPALRVRGSHHGYFDKRGPESDDLVAEVNASGAEIVIVGLGTPLQERWILAHRRALEAPVVWAVGATADFVAGAVRRGPALLHDHGFEWLARLLVEPRRLWQRYLIGNSQFLLRIARHRLSRGGAGTADPRL